MAEAAAEAAAAEAEAEAEAKAEAAAEEPAAASAEGEAPTADAEGEEEKKKPKKKKGKGKKTEAAEHKKEEAKTKDQKKKRKKYPRRMSPLLSAALRLQGVFRAKVARRRIRSARAEEAADEDDESTWLETYDETTGHYYYTNTRTGEETWHKPPGFDGASWLAEAGESDEYPEWTKCCWYFYNNWDGSCSWTQPKNYREPAAGGAGMGMSPMLKAALKIQSAFRARAARVKVRMTRGVEVAAKAGRSKKKKTSVWYECVDPADGGTAYYYNSETGETTWDKPRGFDGETPFEDARAVAAMKREKQRKKIERQMAKLEAKKLKEAEKLKAKQAAKEKAKQKGGKDAKKKKKKKKG